MLDYQSRRFFRSHTFLARDKQCRFRTIVICDRKYGVVPLRDGELSDEIKCDCFERHSFVYGEYGRRCGFCWPGVDFVPLAFRTSLDIIGYVLSHVRPPVPSTC